MSTLNYELQPLFAEPVFRASIGHAITGDQIEFIRNLAMVKNQMNLISENLYIFEEPQLASIKQAVHDVLDVYSREVMGIEQELYVTQSWSLINPPGAGMHGHSHSNSIISGSLYYCEMQEPVAQMVFNRFSSYQQLEFTPGAERRNVYNTPVNVMVPKQNDVLLFSSRLEHFVEVNTSSEPRHAIAFNTFVKGKLGNYRDVSELKL